MAMKGQAQKALFTALISSVFGGIFGVSALLFLSVPLANVSMKFGAPEQFWLCVFALTIIASLSSGNVLKGVIGALIGLVLACVGMDPVTGYPRFTFNTMELMGGITAPQQQPPAKSSRSGVKAALFAGSFLLFFGMSAMVASMVEGVVWWQYWPLIFVILGIVGMVVPGEEGHRMRQFVDSLITFSAGVVLVLMSLDVIGWRSIEFMLVGLWPLLLIMVGLLLLGGALKSPLLTLLAGLCFVAFCVVGLLWYSVPGATEELVFSAPYGREYRFDMQPWENIGLNESVVISITE